MDLSSATCSDSSRYSASWDCKNTIHVNNFRDWAIKTKTYGAVRSWMEVVMPGNALLPISRVRMTNRQHSDYREYWNCESLFGSVHSITLEFPAKNRWRQKQRARTRVLGRTEEIGDHGPKQEDPGRSLPLPARGDKQAQDHHRRRLLPIVQRPFHCAALESHKGG